LIQELETARQARLTLVSASAGFGKTSLAAAWAREIQLPTAWLSLVERDADPHRFLAGCIRAVQEVLPASGAGALAMLQGSPGNPLEPALRLWLEELDASNTPLFLVVDDYHLVNQPAAHQILETTVEDGQNMLHWILLTRSDPLLPLARWRARGWLAEIRTTDLRFTTQETAQFFNARLALPLEDNDLAILQKRTEGWAAGLQLAAIALEREPDRQAFLNVFSGSHRHVVDYLVSEVLQRQTEEVQEFLLSTSILDRLTASLCDELVPHPSSFILDFLDRSNLFLLPLDQTRTWYRYHSLFADLLRSRLQRLHPQEIPGLHRRAAEWFAAQGLLSEAVEHALQSGDTEYSASLIEPAAQRLSMSGDAGLLSAWLERLPTQTIDRRPGLLAARAWAGVSQGNLAQVDPLLSKLDSLDLTDVQRGETAAIRSLVASLRQDIPTAIQAGEQALGLLPEDQGLARSTVAYSLGSAYQIAGNPIRAIPILEEAVRRSIESGNRIVEWTALHGLGDAWESYGALKHAAGLYQRIIDQAADPVLGKLPFIALGYIGLGGILREWNRLEEAEQLLLQSEPWAARWKSSEIRMGTLSSLVMVRQSQGRWGELHTLLNQAEQELRRSGMQPILGMVEASRARAWLLQGRAASARQWAAASHLTGESEISAPTEWEYRVLARVWISEGRLASARDLLERLEQSARENHRAAGLIETLLLTAQAWHLQGDQNRGLRVLQEALEWGEPEGYLSVFLDEGAGLRPLLVEAARQQPDRAYITLLLSGLDARLGLAGDTLLTAREMDVLRCMADGLSNQEIADRLVVALSTVKSHVKSILAKLDAGNRTTAVVKAREMGTLKNL